MSEIDDTDPLAVLPFETAHANAFGKGADYRKASGIIPYEDVIAKSSVWERRVGELSATTVERAKDPAAQEKFVQEGMLATSREWARQFAGERAAALDSADPSVRTVAETSALLDYEKEIPMERRAAETDALVKAYQTRGAADQTQTEFFKQRQEAAAALAQIYQTKNPKWTPQEVHDAVLADLRKKGLEPGEGEGKDLSLPPLPVTPESHYRPGITEGSNVVKRFGLAVYEKMTEAKRIGTAIGEAYLDQGHEQDPYKGVWVGPHTGVRTALERASDHERYSNKYTLIRERMDRGHQNVAGSSLLKTNPVPYLGGLDIAGEIAGALPNFLIMANGALATRGLTMAGKPLQALLSKSATQAAMFTMEGAGALQRYQQYALEKGLSPEETARVALGGAAMYAAAATYLETKGPFEFLEKKIPGIKRKVLAAALLGATEAGTESLQSITQSALAYGVDIRDINWKNVKQDLLQAGVEGLVGGIMGAGAGAIAHETPGPGTNLQTSAQGPGRGPGGGPLGPTINLAPGGVEQTVVTPDQLPGGPLALPAAQKALRAPPPGVGMTLDPAGQVRVADPEGTMGVAQTITQDTDARMGPNMAPGPVVQGDVQGQIAFDMWKLAVDDRAVNHPTEIVSPEGVVPDVSLVLPGQGTPVPTGRRSMPEVVQFPELEPRTFQALPDFTESGEQATQRLKTRPPTPRKGTKPVVAAPETAAQTIARLEKELRTDTLTGLGNKRQYNDTVTAFQQWANTNNQPVSVALGDLAAFKVVNDLFGHDAGDAVLQSIAESLRGATEGREGDIIVTRQGGDEFAVFMRGASEADARMIVQRIEDAIGRREVIPGLHSFAAFGVATFSPGGDMDAVLKQADARTIERKQAVKAELGDPLTRAGAETAIAEYQARMADKTDPTPSEEETWVDQGRPGESPRETEQRLASEKMLADTRRLGIGQEGTYPTSLMTTPYMTQTAKDAAKAVGPIARTVPGSEITPPHRTYEEGSTDLKPEHKNVWVRQSRDRTNSKRILMIQFSSDTMQGERNEGDAYYDAQFDNRASQGYRRLADFWEIPTWLGRAANNLSNVDVYVVRPEGLPEALKFLNEAGYGRVSMSVLDVNARMAREIAEGYKGPIDVGGYVDFGAAFEGLIATPAAPTTPATFGSLGGTLVSANGEFSLPESAVMYAPDAGTLAGGFVTTMDKETFTATVYVEPKAKAVKGIQTQPRVERELGFFPSKEAAQAAIDSVNDKTPPAEPTGHVTPWTSIEDWIASTGATVVPGTNYRHFAGSQTIPRLTLSDGCTHGCFMCSVTKKLTLHSREDILAQVDSFGPLDAAQVYISDKTFFQAKNWKILAEVNTTLKGRSPNFRGFVIQTTATDLVRVLKQDPEALHRSGIQFVELGMESYNDDVLKGISKPHRTADLDAAVQILREQGVAFIPNTIIGLRGETNESYGRTLNFIRTNADAISHLNVNTLAVYKGTRLATDVQGSAADNDQTIVAKSWNTPEQNAATQKFATELFALGIQIAKMPPVGMREQVVQEYEATAEQVADNPAPWTTEDVFPADAIPDGKPQADFISGLKDFLTGEEEGSFDPLGLAESIGAGLHGAMGEVGIFAGGIHGVVLDERGPLAATPAGQAAVSIVDEAEARHRRMRAPLILAFDAAMQQVPWAQRGPLKQWLYAMRDDGQTNWSTAIEHPERVQQWPSGAREMVAAYQNMLDVTGQAATAALIPQLRAEYTDEGVVWKTGVFQQAEQAKYLRMYTQEGMDLLAFQDRNELWDALVAWGQEFPERNPHLDFSDPEKLRVQLEGARQGGKTKKAGSLEFVRIFRELPVALKHPKTGKWVPIQLQDPRGHFLAAVENQSRRIALWSTAIDFLLQRYGSFNAETQRLEYPLEHNADLVDVDGLLNNLRSDVVRSMPAKTAAAEAMFNRLLDNYQRTHFGGYMEEYLVSMGTSKIAKLATAVDRSITANVLMISPIWDLFNPTRSAAVAGLGNTLQGYASAVADMVAHPTTFAAEYQAMGAVIDGHAEWTMHRETWFDDLFVRNVPQALTTVGRLSEVRSQFTIARIYDLWVQGLNKKGNLSVDDARLLQNHLRLTHGQLLEISQGRMSEATRAKVLQNAVNTVAGLTEAQHRKGAIQNHPIGRFAFRFLSVVNAVTRASIRHTADVKHHISTAMDATLPIAQRQQAGLDAMKAGWRMLVFVGALAGSGFLQKYLRRLITGQPLTNVEDPEGWAASLAAALAEGGVYGPFYRIAEANKYSRDNLFEMPARLVFPLAVVAEVGSALIGVGRYKGSPWDRRLTDLGLQYTPVARAMHNWIDRHLYPTRATYTEVRGLVTQYNKGRGLEVKTGWGENRDYEYLAVFEAIRDGDEEALARSLSILRDKGRKAGLDGKTVRERLRASLSSRRPVNLSSDPKSNQHRKFVKSLPDDKRALVVAEDTRFHKIMDRVTRPPTSKAADWYGQP